MLGAMTASTLITLTLLISQPHLWTAYDRCTDQDMSSIWASLPECDPRPTLVPVTPPADPNILQVIPSQVLVDRCAGTCHLRGSSRYHRCVPSNVSNATVKVMYEKIVLQEDAAPTVEEVCGQLQVEVHSSCLCGCEEINCTAAQVYDQRTCSCRCRDHAARGQCLVQNNKVWDGSRCACHCNPDEVTECSTGFIYDAALSCSCVRAPSSSSAALMVLGVLMAIMATTTVILALLLVQTKGRIERDTWEKASRDTDDSD